MVIYANQTLRVAYTAISNLLHQISNAESLDQVKEKISSMEEIFKLQEMYDVKELEKNIEKNLKELGYM